MADPRRSPIRNTTEVRIKELLCAGRRYRQFALRFTARLCIIRADARQALIFPGPTQGIARRRVKIAERPSVIYAPVTSALRLFHSLQEKGVKGWRTA